ncbi:hypothetical protein NMY22_g7885 [Coprinellus aureogranulatus]|nr:hypothetical protein NMY22_g7885 [Coprinellus aureogranulatus]
MDSFTTISLTSDKAPATVKIPADAEGPGSGQTGGGPYCVVFSKDVTGVPDVTFDGPAVKASDSAITRQPPSTRLALSLPIFAAL